MVDKKKLIERPNIISLLILLVIPILVVNSYPVSVSANPENSKIVRISGHDRYQTAIEICKRIYTNAYTVILVRGDNYPDGILAGTLARKYNAPILLTYPYKLNDDTAQEIKRIQAKEAVLLGGNEAISQKVIDDLEIMCGIPPKNITRIGGADRFETSSKVAQALGKPKNNAAIIANGDYFADILSASGMAALSQMPILLVDLNFVYPHTQKVLKQFAIDRTILIGDDEVIRTSMARWFDNQGYHATRLYGKDRYETSKAIFDFCMDPLAVPPINLNPANFVVATGEDFPDALCSSYFSAIYEAPFVITRTKTLSPSVREILEKLDYKSITQVFIIGEPDVVSDRAVSQIERLITENNTSGSLVMFSPHPDDDILGATSILYQNRGKREIKIIYITNGDASQRVGPYYAKKNPQNEDYINFGYVRIKESLESLSDLGITSDNAIYLGFPDMGLKQLWATNWSNPYKSLTTGVNSSPYSNSYQIKAPYTGEILLNNLKDIIKSLNPKDIYLPYRYDTNSDHQAVYLFIRLALDKLDEEGELTRRINLHEFLIHYDVALYDGWFDWPLPTGYHPDLNLRPPGPFPPPDENVLLDNNLKNIKKIAIERHISYEAKSMVDFLFSFIKNNEIFWLSAY